MSYEKETPMELMKHGGDWLAAARNYLKWHGGDSLTWGSNQPCNLTVRQVEELAADAAAAAINAERAMRSVGL